MMVTSKHGKVSFQPSGDVTAKWGPKDDRFVRPQIFGTTITQVHVEDSTPRDMKAKFGIGMTPAMMFTFYLGNAQHAQQKPSQNK